MRWIIVDVVLVLLAVALLGLAGLSLWRRVRALGRGVAAAGEQLATVTAALETLSAPREFAGPTPPVVVTPGGAAARGVGSARRPRRKQ